MSGSCAHSDGVTSVLGRMGSSYACERAQRIGLRLGWHRHPLTAAGYVAFMGLGGFSPVRLPHASQTQVCRNESQTRQEASNPRTAQSNRPRVGSHDRERRRRLCEVFTFPMIRLHCHHTPPEGDIRLSLGLVTERARKRNRQALSVAPVPLSALHLPLCLLRTVPL